MTLPVFARADWMTDAACKGYPTDWWFPPHGARPTKAKTICAGCPVRDECLQHALDTDERKGIWGGVSIDRERRRRRAGSGAPQVERPKPGGPIPHGTPAGYRAHMRRGVPVCDECREARNADRRAARAEGRSA